MTELKLHLPGLLSYVAALAIVGLLTYYKLVPQEAGGAVLIAILGAMVPSGAVRSVVVAPVAPESGDVSMLLQAEVKPAVIPPEAPTV